MIKYAKKLAVVGVASASLLLFFQNCGQAGFDNSDPTLDESSTIDPKLSNLPFPYEVSVNQIAYMSCPLTGTAQNDQMFTFRVGSYDNTEVPVNTMGLSTTGIKLSADYFTKFKAAVSTYSSTIYKDKLVEALSGAANAQYATPFLSVRAKSETKTSPFFGDGSTSLQQREMLAPLGDMTYTQTFRDDFANLPAKTVSFFNFAKFTMGSKLKLLSGAITMPAQEAQLASLKSLLINQYLTVSFVDPNTQLDGFDSPIPYGPDANNDHIYGRGYSFYFEKPRTNYNATATNALMISQEIDLATGNPVSATWDCSRRLKIVPQDVRDSLMWTSSGGTAPICPVELYTERNGSTANRQTFNLLSRFLNPEAWDINVSHGCVVSKIAGCYANSQNVVYDEFYFTNPQPTASPRQSAGCGGSGQFQCPHFLTLCVRR